MEKNKKNALFSSVVPEVFRKLKRMIKKNLN